MVRLGFTGLDIGFVVVVNVPHPRCKGKLGQFQNHPPGKRNSNSRRNGENFRDGLTKLTSMGPYGSGPGLVSPLNRVITNMTRAPFS